MLEHDVPHALTGRQGRVLHALASSGPRAMGTEDLARELEVRFGLLLVTLRSLQRGGLVRAVPSRRGAPAVWMATLAGSAEAVRARSQRDDPRSQRAAGPV